MGSTRACNTYIIRIALAVLAAVPEFERFFWPWQINKYIPIKQARNLRYVQVLAFGILPDWFFVPEGGGVWLYLCNTYSFLGLAVYINRPRYQLKIRPINCKSLMYKNKSHWGSGHLYTYKIFLDSVGTGRQYRKSLVQRVKRRPKNYQLTGFDDFYTYKLI